MKNAETCLKNAEYLQINEINQKVVQIKQNCLEIETRIKFLGWVLVFILWRKNCNFLQKKKWNKLHFFKISPSLSAEARVTFIQLRRNFDNLIF